MPVLSFFKIHIYKQQNEIALRYYVGIVRDRKRETHIRKINKINLTAASFNLNDYLIAYLPHQAI